MLTALRNNILWVVVFTPLTVFLGLILAVMLDRVEYETTVKFIIFMPMAISFVGASVIWKFVYAYRPALASQKLLPHRRWSMGMDGILYGHIISFL